MKNENKKQGNLLDFLLGTEPHSDEKREKQKVFRLLARPAGCGDYIELIKGSLAFCEKTRDYDNERSREDNIAVDYKLEEIIWKIITIQT